jgi:hypothetical protein
MEKYVQSQPYFIPVSFFHTFEDRLKQSNTFPLLALLVCTVFCVSLEYVIYHYFYKTSIQVMEWLVYLRNGCQRLPQSLQQQQQKPDPYRPVTRKNAVNGFVHPYQLIALKDPLRVESAPYTGIYYRFLGTKRDALMNHAHDDDDEEDEEDGETGQGKKHKKKGCCRRVCSFLFCCGCFGKCCCKCCCSCCRKKNKKTAGVSDDQKTKKKPSYEVDSDAEGEEDEDLEAGKKGKEEEEEEEKVVMVVSRTKPIRRNNNNKNEAEEDAFLEEEAQNTIKKRGKGKGYIRGYEHEDGWEITEMGLEYNIKVKIWSKTGIGVDGVLHNKGQHQRTFELLADTRCHTYQLQFVPTYKLAFMALRDQDFTSSLVEDYGKRTSILKNLQQFDPRLAELNVIDQIQDAIVKKKNEKFMEKVEKVKEELKAKKNKKYSNKVVPVEDDDTAGAENDEGEDEGDVGVKEKKEKEKEGEADQKKRGILSKLFSKKGKNLQSPTKHNKDEETKKAEGGGGTRPSSRSTTDNPSPVKRAAQYSSGSEEEEGEDDEEEEEESSEEESESEDEESSEEEESEEDDEEEDSSEEEESNGEEEEEEEESSEEESDEG